MRTPIDYRKRLYSLDDELTKRRLDAFLVTNETNVSYLSGFSGHDCLLLVTKKEKFFITDSRYVEEAEAELKGFDIILVNLSTYKKLEALIKKRRLKRIGFESMSLPYEVAARLKGSIGRSHLVPIKDLIEDMRAIKDDAEVRLIKDSIRLTKDVLNKVMDFLRPGLSEKSLCKKIELEFIERDAHPSFQPIVASGKNASKPHAKPGDAKIEQNSFIMIDIGCSPNGYNSDLTRMVFLGKVKEKIKKIYSIVHGAQRKAISKIRPGVRFSEVDFAARGYIHQMGFGKYFGHSLGHGVGLEVHEDPSVSRRNTAILKPGMVFTIEPAVYIPKFGGVRIEDMVLVTDSGCEILTR